MKHDPTLYEPKRMFCQISSIGSIVGAGASILGGLFASDAAGDASDAQVRAAQIAADLGREGLDFQKETFDVNRADTDPFRASGTAALGTLNNLFIPGGQNVVQMHSQLNALRARREVLARSGPQPEPGLAPVQQDLGPPTSNENLARVRFDRQLLLQNEGGGDGGGGGGGGGGGSGGGACCFVAGILVTMGDGTQKKIEDVEIGEKVQGSGGLNAVVGLNRPLLERRPLIALNDSEPFTTWDHPFWDDEKDVWRCVSPQHRKNTAGLVILPLKIGNKIATVKGDVEITAIMRVALDPETQLYDLKLDGDHTYIADGYIVHNC